ncbi:hypothetical protein H7347_06765 [Corynebacterium sp. zg-331]|uniref:hypothetical protein n=1 Tax=unclassified Corynebacterium TaxID=2624378 RepID=UPI00128CF3C9|nr:MULTISPECIES: hypothetical protein [unclassified Corynebacterium]MBC3186274.1 hypothetical protein [Corynebacterium sp. zg-331]MPV52762.1 hypothetical protein [Corynebacterium sp. zg331]
MHKIRRFGVSVAALAVAMGATAAPAMACEKHEAAVPCPLVNVEFKPSIQLADEIEIEDLDELSTPIDVLGQAREAAQGLIAPFGLSF